MGLFDQAINFANQRLGTAVNNVVNNPVSKALVNPRYNIFSQLGNPQAQLPRANIAEPVAQAAQKAIPIPGVKPVVRFLAGIPESIANVPSDFQQGAAQTATDIGNGQVFNPRVAVSDAAKLALPVATVATLGVGGAAARQIPEQVVKEGLFNTVKQGAVTGAKYGAGFGAGAAFSEGRDESDPVRYGEKLAESILTNAAGGAAVGTFGALGTHGLQQAGNFLGEHNLQPGGIDLQAPVSVPTPESIMAKMKAGTRFKDLTPEEQQVAVGTKQETLQEVGGGFKPGERQTLDRQILSGNKQYSDVYGQTPKTGGELQEADQRANGLGLLADLDIASRSNDMEATRKIVTDIMRQPDGSPYDPYKKTLYSLMRMVKPFAPEKMSTPEPVFTEPPTQPVRFLSGVDKPEQPVPGGLENPAQEAGLFNKPQPTQPADAAKERGFISTVKTSDQAPQGLKDLVSGTYNLKTNDTLKAQAAERILKDPVAATQFAISKNTDEATATAIQLVKQLSEQGNHQAAADLVNQKAAQLTEAGRTIQAASLFDSLSPEGVGQLAARTIQNYNETAGRKIPELTGEQLKTFQDQAAAIKALPDGSRQQDMARQQLLKQMAKLVPSSAVDKALGIWRAGLLTGPQTVTKIGISHAAMSALEQAKNIPTAMADSVMSLLTGKRSMSLTPKGLFSGGKQGVMDAVDNLFKNYEAPNSGGFSRDFKNTTNYGNSLFGKAAQAYVDGVGRLHGSLYKPFFGAAHLNSLYDQALTEAKNAHLRGDAKNSFVLQFVKDPSPEALKVAERDAGYATFQQKTLLGSAASGLQRNLGPVGKVIAPFTRIPSAILTDAIDYTPVGIVKSTLQAIHNGTFTQDAQRQLAQGIGRGVAGTGLIAIGASLYDQGMLNLDRPQNPKELAQWDLEGRKPQSIKIDGQWKNLASLGPLGHVLGMGGYFQKGLQDNGIGGALSSAGFGAAKITMDQPYLTQIANINQALQQPQQKALAVEKSLASSIVPTLFGTVARAIDPLQRETNTVPDALQNKIPVKRQELLPKRDTLGNPMQRSGSILQNLVDPFQSTTDTSGAATGNPVVTELGRLNTAGNPAAPSYLGKNQTIHGVKMTLTPQQLDVLESKAGPAATDALTKLFATDKYQAMNDQDKANEVSKVLANARKGVRDTLDLSSPDTKLAKPGKPSTAKPKAPSKSKGLFGSTKSSGLFKSSASSGLFK